MNEALIDLIKTTAKHHQNDELALGYLRYETLRCLNVNDIANLHLRNLRGEKYDDMIDELVIRKYIK